MTDPETPLSRRDAERLLDAPAEHDHVLGWALSAAAAPGHPDELVREDATVAAFHAARVSPPPARRSHFVSPTRLGSRAAAQALVATAAVVTLASGGFALTGAIDLPSLPGQAADRAADRATDRTSAAKPTDGSGSAGAGGASGSAGGSAAGRPTRTTGSGATTESPSESADSPTSSTSTDEPTPTPDLAGLCKAYQAADRDHGRSLDSAAFTALATAAGGAAGIADYCVDLIGAPTPTDKPTPTNKPTDKPTPTSKPTPTTKPTPTDKPSPGKPTDTPAQSGNGGGKDSSTSGS